MFASISSSRPENTEIDAFAGGSKSHTILSTIEKSLLNSLDFKTILSLRITCKEAKQSVANYKHVHKNKIINFTLPDVSDFPRLDMAWYDNITDADFKYLKGIHTLDIEGCDQITDAAFQYMNGIHTLNIAKCEQITGEGFKHLHGLHTLNMAYCTGITDEAFVHLKGIRMLNMGNCSNITDNAIVHLKGIYALNMYGCPNISDDAIMHLKGIYALNIIGCRKITRETIKEHLQGIKYIYIPDIVWYEQNGYFNFFLNRCERNWDMKIEYDKSILEYILPGASVLEYNEWSYKHGYEYCDDEYCDNEECYNEDVQKIMKLPY
jgi:hypothetical protein